MSLPSNQYAPAPGKIVISASFSAQPPYERHGSPSRSTGGRHPPVTVPGAVKGRSGLMAK